MEVEEQIEWIRKAGEVHISRFSRLSPLKELEGELHGVKDPRYLMYKIGSMSSGNKSRKYEFLIEYDTYNPSQGIYFGCKSITLTGFNHGDVILNAVLDWEKIKSKVARRLNNVFITKDFTSRFKVTDNAHNNTYWPFWISLHEDEDIVEVGLRALDIIRQSYKELSGDDWEIKDISVIEFHNCNVLNPIETAFTHKAFETLKTNLKRNAKQCLTNHVKGTEEKYWERFLFFIEKSIENGILHRNKFYQQAWMVDARLKDTDFSAFVRALFNQIGKNLKVEGCKIPWNNLIKIFMHSDETPYKIQVKTLNVKEEKLKYWDECFNSQLDQYLSSVDCCRFH